MVLANHSCQLETSQEEGTSTEKLPPSYWPGGIFLMLTDRGGPSPLSTMPVLGWWACDV